MLDRQVKLQVFREIVSIPKFLGKYEEYDGIVTFLNKIWDLREMPSEDQRFKNAYEDCNQHLINNNDWEIDYLFLERFKLIDEDEKYFILFLESIVNPTVRNNTVEIRLFVTKINSIIQSAGFRLILTDYFEEFPVYKFRESSKFSDLPEDIISNKIPVYFLKNNDKKYPCFILSYSDWDDYGRKTQFKLYYYNSNLDYTSIGIVKIMKSDVLTTSSILANEFTSLSNDFCSLGQSKSYYFKLKEILVEKYASFLLAMRDSATFPKIHELFENDKIFTNSLIRNNESERILRTIRYEIEGINPNEYYKFNYTCQPPYSENLLTLNFDFEYDNDFEHRIFALIGKNGTGKTKILSSLTNDLSGKNQNNFSPRKPVYGKVFTVSYSVFDRFEIPTSDVQFNYVYCGLKKNDGAIKSLEDLSIELYEAADEIGSKDRNRIQDWKDILLNFLPNDFVNHLNFKEETKDGQIIKVFDIDKYSKVKEMLSSGQSIMLYVITKILANIRLDSLILFDEPETHLHPNAISSLVNTLFDLVKRFESFCVIATHSPIIIQEIPARNIFVIERDNSSAFVRNLERESFGENLTVITQEIFGNKDVPKHFVRLLETLINKGKTYSEILTILQTSGLTVTSNIRLYIKALMAAQ